jgi:hypothetical protein
MNPLMNTLGVAPKKSIVEQFREFKSSFTGDPQAKLNELVASGKYSKQQVEKATLLANMVKNMRR